MQFNSCFSGKSNPGKSKFLIYLSVNNTNFSLLVREVFKKKRKKNVEFSTSRYFTPPSVKMWKFILFFLPFFSMFQHILSIFEKKNIFPLEKLKTLRIFTQIWSLQEAEPPNPPSPPLTKGKIFFAFLDVSDHLEAKKKKKINVENHPILPPPPVKMWKIPHFFSFFF